MNASIRLTLPDENVSQRHFVSPQEWTARVDLAASHRLLVHLGIEDLTYNHLSARVPGEPDALLIKAPQAMFGQVTASSLLKYRLDGAPLLGTNIPLERDHLVIHAGLLKACPQLDAVFHTHSPANMGVAAQRNGLLPLTQHALLFYGALSYHDFDGFEFEPEQTAALASDLGDNLTMVLRNHGALVCGRSVAEAYVLHHFYEMACRAQIAAMAGGAQLCIPSPAVCERAARQLQDADATRDGGKNWQACLALADRIDPSYRQ